MATILISVREMIDSALGASDANIVNFKMLQNVLHVLAQQLRVLERRVELRGDICSASNASVNVTEVRVQAPGQPRKKDKARGKGMEDADAQAAGVLPAKDTILVVERVSPTGMDQTQSSRGRISVVTQTQFAQLEAVVHGMQYGNFRFSPPPRLSAVIPINEKALADIRAGVLSLPDAMSALQIAARIEATERGIERMTQMISEIAAAVHIDERVDGSSEMPSRIQVLQLPPSSHTGGKQDSASPIQESQTEKAEAALSESSKSVPHDKTGGAQITKGGKQDSASPIQESQTEKAEAALSESSKSVPHDKTGGAQITKGEKQDSASPIQESQTEKAEAGLSESLKSVPHDKTGGAQITKGKGASQAPLNLFEDTKRCVTEEDLEVVRTALETEIQKTVTTTEQRLKAADDLAMNKIRLIEDRLTNLERLEERMDALERNVGDSAAQLNSLDTGLSSQMTYLQEQLNDLQGDLEAGLQQAMESGGGGDTTALADLNSRVANLTADAEAAAVAQQALEVEIKSSADDLRALLEHMEVIKESKVDREELADALRDKADTRALNGLVSEAYFEAVRAQIEGKQLAACDKFSKCELVWQKALDDLHAELNEKADLSQLEPLRDHLDSRLIDLQERLRVVALAAGEPRAAGVTRRLQRDGECLSCSAPAVMLPDAASPVPLLPVLTLNGVRPPAIGAETQADEATCYADWPKTEQRGHVCHRYCGGSHTLLPTGVVTRTPFPDALKVTPAPRKVTPTVGDDGHLYLTEKIIEKIPCGPCNVPHPSRTSHYLQPQPAVSLGESVNICWMDMSNATNVIFSAEPTLPSLPNY